MTTYHCHKLTLYPVLYSQSTPISKPFEVPRDDVTELLISLPIVDESDASVETPPTSQLIPAETEIPSEISEVSAVDISVPSSLVVSVLMVLEIP